jgi:hypothetical protein
MGQSGIVALLSAVSAVGTVVSVGSTAVNTLERWVTPMTAIVVSHLGALGLIVVAVWWHVERGAPPSDPGE